MLKKSENNESPLLTSTDLFRAGAKFIIKNLKENGIKQKTIAIAVNDLHAQEKTACTDLSDFLHGRKDYGRIKQERLARVLGYSHLEIVRYGESILADKIKNFEEEKTLRKVMLKSGKSYSLKTILKMVKEFLISNCETLQYEKSMLIEDIIKKWKAFKVCESLRNISKKK